MSSINYTTKQGETWGTVAWAMYGSMSGIPRLIAANTGVPVDAVLKEGTVLIVPIVDNTDNTVIASKLPPWK